MTLTAAVDHLWESVHQLRDDVQALRLHAVEDRPVGEESRLVEDVGTASETVAGWSEQMLEAAARVVAAARHPADLPGLRQALDDATESVERLAAELLEQLSTTRRLDQLTALAREGGTELRGWVAAIKHALDRVHQSAWLASAALTTCWRELAERAVAGPAVEPAEIPRRS
jgi:methyl-accepting chemotaxis protein